VGKALALAVKHARRGACKKAWRSIRRAQNLTSGTSGDMMAALGTLRSKCPIGHRDGKGLRNRREWSRSTGAQKRKAKRTARRTPRNPW
jgi:hypothetical protein